MIAFHCHTVSSSLFFGIGAVKLGGGYRYGYGYEYIVEQSRYTYIWKLSARTVLLSRYMTWNSINHTSS